MARSSNSSAFLKFNLKKITHTQVDIFSGRIEKVKLKGRIVHDSQIRLNGTSSYPFEKLSKLLQGELFQLKLMKI